MKYTFALVLVLLLLAGFAAAQAPAVPAPIPAMKVAIFNSELLTDEKVGIKRLVAAFKQIDTDFKPKRDEITDLKKKYDAAVAIVQSPPAGMDAKAVAAKAEEVETYKNLIERAQQDGQKAIDKRIKELTDPIFSDIAFAVQAYAKQRGIDVLLDSAKLTGAMMILNDSSDITIAFINDYNARNAGAPVK